MLKQLFPGSLSYARLLQSQAVPWLLRFAEWLVAEGYRPKPAQNHVRRLKYALERAGGPIPLDSSFSVDEVRRFFADHRRNILFEGTERAFFRFLRAQNLLVEDQKPSEYDRLMADYRKHLAQVRGLAPATIGQHVSTVLRFLAEALPVDGRISSLTPQAVEAFVAADGRRVTRQTLQHIVARLRSFLRFCYDQELVFSRLDDIDTARTYRDELPPRALPWNHVVGLLDSIDRSQMSGSRDHAMLYLMAHYGLRPSEIASLTVDSINWVSSTLWVEQRKTRTALILPLSDEALGMFRRYLHGGRPSDICPGLFLTCRSPIRQITHYAVCDVYRKRADLSGLPLQGTSSYCLRHSFAMRLLTRGVGIKIIGDLLGHRSLESTCVYLRIQTEALRGVALPVPLGNGVAQ
jgi:integrase/recombinase XerD